MRGPFEADDELGRVGALAERPCDDVALGLDVDAAREVQARGVGTQIGRQVVAADRRQITDRADPQGNRMPL